MPVTQEDVDAAREKVLWCLGSALLSGSDREARKALNDRHALYSLLGDANCRLVGSIAPQPSPTPQADSQPAPVRDERDDFEKVFPIPSGCVRCGTGYASTGYSHWTAHTHVDRWQGWQARAARAPADSVLEDAGPLQGAANWLAEAHGQFGVAVLQGCLMIGYNRAKRLHDAAIAARKQGGA